MVTSTTGQGDLPDSIVPLFQGIKDSLGFQPNLRYGVIALGDSSYVNFCNGGKQFDALLQEQSAQRVGEMLLIDASENPEPETESNPWVEHWRLPGVKRSISYSSLFLRFNPSFLVLVFISVKWIPPSRANAKIGPH